MAAFTAGTWVNIPTNFTRSFTLTYLRCVSWGTFAFFKCIEWATAVVEKCVSWATQTIQKCVEWAEQTSTKCCDWAPCSWFCDLVLIIITIVCAAVMIVVIWVCMAFALVVIIVCALMVLVVLIVCLLWTLISVVFGLSAANGGTAFLLTDGSLMMQECHHGYGTKRWWKLTPDAFGNYAAGSWSRLADASTGRKYFASAVLADGRVITCGGEYSDATGVDRQDENNSCEIYDPQLNTWKTFATPMTAGLHPVQWDEIGDSPCALLPDGTFLLGSHNTTDVATLDPATLNWTARTSRPDICAEESWVLMPDSTVATVSCNSPPVTFVYDIATDQWNFGNNLPVSVVLAAPGFIGEIGPGLLRYDGTALFIGGNQHTATYSASAVPQWANGIDLPTDNGATLGVMDGPGAILPNGNVFFPAGPINANGDYLSPCSYFEYDGTAFNRTNDPPNRDCATYFTRLLILPNADVLYVREDDSSFFAYHAPTATPQDSFRPVIQSCPPNPMAGTTIQITGTQFNGLSQGSAYGDDSAPATNYPLVRITNRKTKHVRYCRTFNHTSMGVATGNAVVTTNADIPADIDLGEGILEVVANGIPSQPFLVVVRAPLR